MFMNAYNGQLDMGSSVMDYISFGKGSKSLIIIPGLGDGLRTVKGLAVPFALMYRKFAEEYKVWVFSRKQPLETGSTTETMSEDLKTAMDMLGIDKASVVGVSQGGMIAQHLATKYPHTVEKLVLAVTSAGENETIRNVIGSWIDMAESGDFATLTTDNFEKSYSESYLKKYRPFYPFIVPFMKPADSRRFLIQAKACLTHNSRRQAAKINCPVLIIGGRQDKIVTVDESYLLGQLIPDSKVKIYPQFGHALYEEARDFTDTVLNFLVT